MSRFNEVTNDLDSVIEDKLKPEVKSIRDKLLGTETNLFLLLFADLLTHIYKFSKFLQMKNLVFSQIANRFES